MWLGSRFADPWSRLMMCTWFYCWAPDIERCGYMTNPLKYLRPWVSVKHLWAKTPRAYVPAVNKREGISYEMLWTAEDYKACAWVLGTPLGAYIFHVIFVPYLFCCVNYDHEFELLWALQVLLANQQIWEWALVPESELESLKMAI